MAYYVADFETTTNKDDCHVWAFGICEVSNRDNVIIGTSIDEFMHLCEKRLYNPIIYFHNLKFDGQFIIHWLLSNGFTHSTTPEERQSKTFNTLISDKGLYYSIEVVFRLKGKTVVKAVFRDSLKLIPLSVEGIANAFDLPIKKGKINYDSHNDLPIGSPISEEEKEYIRNDVRIVAHAVDFFQSHGLNKMTIGACALNDYKEILTPKKFKLYFPIPKYHNDIKQTYKGGFTYLNPKFAGKIVKKGVVLDINSLYSSVMNDCPLPFGTPIFFKGKYEEDELFPLYTQVLRCQFELKPGKIPTIQSKHTMFYRGSEYLTSSDDEIVTLHLTSVDLKLFLENYDIYNEEWLSGWKFKATTGLFKEYITKWVTIKIQAKEEKNWGLYLIAKLFLNSLYGKFGTSTIKRTKIPYITDNNSVAYKDSEPELRDGVYIAMASFISAYARDKTIRAAQKITDDYNSGKSNIQFIYADTDSLHLLSPDHKLPEGLNIHDTELGAWKFEGKFKRGKFIRQKCYVEELATDLDNPDPEYKLKVTVAGMPEGCHEQVTFRNFKVGAKYSGKMQPEIVPGGVILRHIDFTIQK